MGLTIEEFRATRVATTWTVEKCQSMGYEPSEDASVLVYEDESFIVCLPNGEYWLPIGNEEYQSVFLELMEEILYKDWYLHNL
jgi:hypothetical protein